MNLLLWNGPIWPFATAQTLCGLDLPLYKNEWDVIVVDDMIASGSSMIEVAKDLKERGANKVYLVATFALLTEGPDCFIKAHQEGLFDKLYATNLSYVSDKIKKEKSYLKLPKESDIYGKKSIKKFN